MRSPEDGDAHNDLGLTLLQSGDAPGAIAEFQNALSKKPADTGYETNLGAAYLQKADFAAAARQFESGVGDSTEPIQRFTTISDWR